MINNVTLVGRLTRDVEVKYTQSGTAVASFTLAVNRNFKNQNGEIEADFINCVIWRKPAETMAQYTHKGSLIGAVGRLQTRSYDDKNGQRVYITEVVCDNFQMLESKKSGGDGQPQQQQTKPQNNGYNQGFSGQQAEMDMTYQMPSDADLPF